MAQDPGRGTLILVLGIVSLVCCTLVGPLAWIWGKQDLEKIKRLAAQAQAGLDSEDPSAVKKAEAQLRQVSKDLRAWAKKYKLAVVPHTEAGGGAATPRRRCAGEFATVLRGKLYLCFLIGREGRKCLYECVVNAPTDPDNPHT